MPDCDWYRERINELLDLVDDRELCLIYTFIRAIYQREGE